MAADYTRICVNCVHHEDGFDFQYTGDGGVGIEVKTHDCTQPVNLVTGKKRPVCCATARRDGCGPEGRYFEAAK